MGRKRSGKNKNGLVSLVDREVNPIKSVKSQEPIKPLNDTQKTYISAIKSSILTFGIGPAGTGKTYVAGSLAAEALDSGEIRRVVVTRPAIEAGESMGFLPGEIEEKFEPYLRPFRDVLNDRLGRTLVDYLIKRRQVEAIPLAFMRGHTFNDCWVILDEAQNTTPTQMKLLLSRTGRNCKVIVDGDLSQSDIGPRNGLYDALKRLQGVRGSARVDFTRDDIVRSGFVKDVIRRYEDYNEESEAQSVDAWGVNGAPGFLKGSHGLDYQHENVPRPGD